jgi:endo-1,4-beta-mannosidase
MFWIKRLTQEIKKIDPDHPITLGMHQGDLGFDTKFHPQALSQYIDIPSMHGYPNYSDWARNPLDSKSLAFLNCITEQMSKKKVLFAEFGLPTSSHSIKKTKMFFAKQNQASHYFKNALNHLHRIGALGALVWCYADYYPKLKFSPPFDQAPHELCFGITNWKGKIKKTGRVLSQWANRKRNVRSSPILKNFSTKKHYQAPARNLNKLYQIFIKQF